MQNFYNSFTFIISFMILVLIFNMLLGSKFTEKFLLLILLGMVLFNANKVSGVFNGISSVNKEVKEK